MFPKPTVKEAGAAREPVPAGNHVCRCYLIVDLGDQVKTWQGEEKIRREVLIGFELCNETMQDGRPFAVSSTYTFSLGERANLRRILEGWRGRPFTDQELTGFAIENLLGKPAMVQVSHRLAANGKTYTNIQTVSAMPKGLQAPEAVNPLTLYSPEYHDAVAWDRLPEWLQRRVGERVNVSDTLPSKFDDDEIPF